MHRNIGQYLNGSLRFGRLIYIKTEQRETLHNAIREKKRRREAAELQKNKDTLLMIFASKRNVVPDFVLAGQFAKPFVFASEVCLGRLSQFILPFIFESEFFFKVFS